MRRNAGSLVLLLGAFLVLGLVAGACGAAEAPTPTPTVAAAPPTPTAAVAAPVPTPTAFAVQATPQPAPTRTPTPAGVQPKYGGIGIFAHRGDPPRWDAMFTGSITTGQALAPLAGDGNLVKPCREDVFAVCPMLATKWEANRDFTQWTFTLREGATWHDGKPLTGDDVKLWLELASKGVPPARPPSIWAPNVGKIESIKAEGNTVTVTLGVSTPSYLILLYDPKQRFAQPKHLMQPEIDKGNAAAGPDKLGYVATGPFKMQSYVRGSVIRVRRYDKYYEKDAQGRQLPFMDGIDYPIIGDANTMVAAFRAGRIDMTSRGGGFDLNPEQRAAILKDLGADKVFFPAGWQSINKGLTPNPDTPPWNDVRVRQAVSLWIDRRAGCTVTLGGDCVITPLMPVGSPFLNPDWEQWPGFNPKTRDQDRAEAKRLLTEAGFPNGFPVKFMCPSEWIHDCEFNHQQLSGLLGAANVKVDVVPNLVVWEQRICERTDALYITGGLSGDLAPEGLAANFSSKNNCARIYRGDPRIDEIMGQMLSAPNQEARVKAGRDLERYIVKEKVYLIHYWKALKVIGIRTYVKGFLNPAAEQDANLDHATLWLEK